MKELRLLSTTKELSLGHTFLSIARLVLVIVHEIYAREIRMMLVV